uniref:1-acyl-sn-glycerol-3-phosphate acyltransferase PLS1 n=1 Tax=Arundo donax TaxID=35708 RepID=A0A0A9FL73_ARUDO
MCLSCSLRRSGRAQPRQLGTGSRRTDSGSYIFWGLPIHLRLNSQTPNLIHLRLNSHRHRI